MENEKDFYESLKRYVEESRQKKPLSRKDKTKKRHESIREITHCKICGKHFTFINGEGFVCKNPECPSNQTEDHEE